MIARRGFLLAGSAFAVQLRQVLAGDVSRLAFGGALKQGGLVIGTARGASVKVDGVEVDVSPAGVFAFGLGYDQTRPTSVEAKFPDGKIALREVLPGVRKYDVQRVDGLPQDSVTPPPETRRRIERENAMVAAARMRSTAATDFVRPFDWPVKGIVSGWYGSQRIDNGTPMSPHFGIDIAAPPNSPIHAPADGVVSLAEPDFYLTGGTTVIDHGHGVSTVYIHQNELKVAVGASVKRGELIGLVGMKGRATGPHLHWGMNWFQMRLDPSLSTATPTPDKA